MNKHNQENVLDGSHEDIEVTFEDDYDHCDEYNDREILQWLLQQLCDLRKILSAKNAEHKRNTHDYEDALEYLSERYFKFR